MGRTDAEQAAIACRDAHRSAGIRAECEVDQPRGDRGGRAAARAAGEPVRRARIDRGALPDVLAGEAVGEFHRLGLAGQPGPCLQQRGHDRGGRGRGRMRARPVRITVGRDAAGDVEQVLHREAEAGQPSAAERLALQPRVRGRRRPPCRPIPPFDLIPARRPCHTPSRAMPCAGAVGTRLRFYWQYCSRNEHTFRSPAFRR